jgi:type IV pilus assembly protein PilX
MKTKQNQQGAVLLIGLIMVIVLSVLIAGSVKTTLLQQKMTVNLRDKDLSFQAAESALRAGELYLQDTDEGTLSTAFDDSNGLYQFNKSRDLSSDTSWSSLSTVDIASLHQVRGKAGYMVEELPPIKAPGESLAIPMDEKSHYYRVTSKSKGGTDNAETILQSTYKKNGG